MYDASALTNSGQPTIVTQWGCWNAYYVHPTRKSMADHLLLSGDRGAAAVFGAATLSYDASERALGTILTAGLVTPGNTIGAALRDAKIELNARHPEMTDVLLGWTLLGDPALVVER